MKISPPIDAIAAELEAWALVDGWKTVGLAVTRQYHADGGGDVLPIANTEKALGNAIQRVKRIFRGCDGPRYARQAEELKAAALAALPFERRVSLELPGDPVVLAAVAAKEGIEAINAVNLGAAPAQVIQAIHNAIAAFLAIKAVFEQLMYGELHEVYRGRYA